jgi:hypothetical protein
MLLRVRISGLFIASCFSCIHFESDSEEAEGRLEGWATSTVRAPTLRDALLWSAPQGEVVVGKAGSRRL